MNKGTTNRYDDYIQPIQELLPAEPAVVLAMQVMPATYYTEPSYIGEQPAGIYSTEHPYNLIKFEKPLRSNNPWMWMPHCTPRGIV